jgi:hypothetical protein
MGRGHHGTVGRKKERTTADSFTFNKVGQQGVARQAKEHVERIAYKQGRLHSI